jgi:general transcription factor 3C polypeptide 5 (transcription factor C subunit 1)
MAILNQFTVNEAREIHKYVFHSGHQTAPDGHASSKNMLPLLAYVFSDGPWRDTHIRFGYDPRQKPETRMCGWFLI